MQMYDDYVIRAEYVESIASSSRSKKWVVTKEFHEESDFGSCILHRYDSRNLSATIRFWSSGAVSFYAGDQETGEIIVGEKLVFGDEVKDFVELVSPFVQFLNGAHE